MWLLRCLFCIFAGLQHAKKCKPFALLPALDSGGMIGLWFCAFFSFLYRASFVFSAYPAKYSVRHFMPTFSSRSILLTVIFWRKSVNRLHFLCLRPLSAGIYFQHDAFADFFISAYVSLFSFQRTVKRLYQ